MSWNMGLWFFCVGLILWLAYRLNKTSLLLEKERGNLGKIQNKNISLQRTLKTRGRRLDVLLSTVSEVVLRVDRQGRVLGGNVQAEELFRFSTAAALPQSMLIFYRDGEWLKQYQLAIDALPKQVVLPEMKVAGRVLLPRLAALGKKEALLLCLDVTAYTQLQQKQKSLLENLMHDLKTPLTSLLGYARSIEAFADDAELRQEATSVIAKEAKHINDLMNSMLTLNQIEYHKTDNVSSCQVSGVCQQVWESLQYQMLKKSIDLELDAETEALVAISEEDCHRVITNIAENALKFSPSNSIIKCHVGVSGDDVTIVIEDAGYGIPEAHITRVVERFYRVDHVRGREKTDGHGLGLAIVKETLERDGGCLALKNSDAGGLIVTMTLPKA